MSLLQTMQQAANAARINALRHPSSSFLADYSRRCDEAIETVHALIARNAELEAALPDMMALYRLKWGNLDPAANTVYSRVENALAARAEAGHA